jgi:hypothetical protein
MEATEVTIQRQVYSAMETGNLQAAATLLDELQELNPQFTVQLRADLAETYGTSL